MKILHIVGNRPQFIKLALLLNVLGKKDTSNIILHTGQHFDSNMFNIFFDELHIAPPNYTLGINNLSHNVMIGRMLMEIDPIVSNEMPTCAIVYGDTNSTLAGALAAKKRNVPVVHIEAGIRTGNEQMPEEANRYITDRISTLNFCSTHTGIENLEKEGYFSGGVKSAIYNSGDLMLDASMFFKDIALRKAKKTREIDWQQPFVLSTIHRTENIDNLDTLQKIIISLNNIHQHTSVIFPMHPKTRMTVATLKIQPSFPLYNPVGYLEMLALVQNCQSVITDSGGLSREGFFFHKPTLVIMRNPFWPELFIHGNCMQSAADTEEINSKHERLLSTDKSFTIDVFGNGRAAENISNTIVSAF